MREVLIVDDHGVTRRGMREIVGEVFPDGTIGEASDFASLLDALAQQRWSLILLDIMIPGGTVLDALARIRAADPAVPVLVVTAATETEYVTQVLQAGANGLIHKHLSADDLMQAIRIVAEGRSYLHPETAVAMAAALAERRTPLPHDSLSPRELEVLRLVARGMTVKVIAGALGISDKTVATYLARIREKTGLNSHVEIARYALQHRLVD